MKDLSRLIRRYNSAFGENFTLKGMSIEDIYCLLESVQEMKKVLKLKENFSSLFESREYNKYLLLEQILRRVIREIHPGRTRFRKKEYKKC